MELGCSQLRQPIRKPSDELDCVADYNYTYAARNGNANSIQSSCFAMRLRLIIERHLLPPVKVVWTVGRVLPPMANAGASYTISQLLEQIDQTIPLQSDQWKLEDYVVETGGFECLHFSQIGDALNSDAKVRYVNLCLPVPNMLGRIKLLTGG